MTLVEGQTPYERGQAIKEQMFGSRERAPRDQRVVGDFEAYARDVAWTRIWARPGLDLRTRSAITIMVMVALDKPVELAMHIEGGLRNGLTVEEIVEIIIQATGYCGFPAGNSAFRVAEPLLSAHLDRNGEGR